MNLKEKTYCPFDHLSENLINLRNRKLVNDFIKIAICVQRKFNSKFYKEISNSDLPKKMWKILALASIALGLYMLDIDGVNSVSINFKILFVQQKQTKGQMKINTKHILCVMIEHHQYKWV